MSCVPGDLNEDGLTDVLVYYWGRTPLAFLRREGSQAPALDSSRLRATNYTIQALVPGGERWYTNAV